MQREQERFKAEEVSRKQLATNLVDFEIENGALKKYKGAGCNVVIPNSVTSIGDYAFNSCARLTEITLPNSVTSIGYMAFCKCTGLTSITIPNSVTSIGNSAFFGCTGLTSVAIPNNKITIWDIRDIRDILERPPIKFLSEFAPKIPAGVTEIGDSTFCGCTGLKDITIPDSMIETWQKIFSDSKAITNLTITDTGANSIKIRAFEYCSGLISVNISNSVTSIGEKAFLWCSGLANVTIPNSVTSIGRGAFFGCTALADVYYSGSKKEWKKISIERDNKALKKATIHFDCKEEK